MSESSEVGTPFMGSITMTPSRKSTSGIVTGSGRERHRGNANIDERGETFENILVYYLLTFSNSFILLAFRPPVVYCDLAHT